MPGGVWKDREASGVLGPCQTTGVGLAGTYPGDTRKNAGFCHLDAFQVDWMEAWFADTSMVGTEDRVTIC